MKTYKILMAEPSDMIVKGFQEMLGEDTPFQVCGRVPSADGLAEALGRYRPAVLLINPSVLGSSTISQMGALMADFPNVVPVALAYQFFPADTLKPFVAVIDVFDNKFQIESKLKQALKSQSQVESEEGYELTQEEAEAYLAELADVELDDETLNKAAGGDSCYFVQCPSKCLDCPDFKPPAV